MRPCCLCFLIGFITTFNAFALQQDSDQPASTPTPNPELLAAQQHLQKGRYEEAIDAYVELAADPKSSALAESGLARCYVATGDFDNAESAFNKCLAVEDAPAELRADLLAQWGVYLFNRGRYAEAKAAAQKSLSSNPDQPYAHWVVASVLTEIGQIEMAEREWRWFSRYYNRAQPEDAKTLIPLGLGAANYARWTSSSQIFRFLVNTVCVDALKDDPDCWQASLLSGSLLLEKYNKAQGLPDVKAALAINSRAGDVLVALGREAIERRDYKSADDFVLRSLKSNPQHVASLILKADLALRAGQFKDAERTVSQGLKVNPRHQYLLAQKAMLAIRDTMPTTEQLRSLLAGFGKEPSMPTDVGAGQFESVVRQVAANNTRPGEFLTVVANGLDEQHQFELAEICYLKAIEVMPQLSRPRTELGMLYMQTGRTIEARRILDAAFKADPFHVRVSNMRKVLGILEGYGTISTDHFVVHFDKQADRILGHLMAEYLELAYDELVEHYDFEPERVHFEIYHNGKGQTGHQWFSARMVGMPWIQTIGASTGVMIAMASPNALQRQKFNWARVAKHELAHIITLQQTRYRIPRWFTEGLAVASEDMVAPVEWQKLLATRVPMGDIWQLDELNEILIKYPSQADWSMAYCQSSLYVQFMEQKFGAKTISQMLNAYRVGQSTDEAIAAVFGVSVDEFQQQYVAFVKEQIQKFGYQKASINLSMSELKKQYESDKDDLTAKADYALALLVNRQGKRAIPLAKEVLAVDKTNGPAAIIVSAVLLSNKDYEGAVDVLQPAAKVNNARSDVLSMYGRMLLKAGQTDEALVILQDSAKRFPHEPKWLELLVDAWTTKGDQAELKSVLERLIVVDRDNIEARRSLAEMFFADEQFEAAAEMALETLYADATDPVAHRIRALSLVKLGQTELARKAIEFAIETNPNDPALKSLK